MLGGIVTDIVTSQSDMEVVGDLPDRSGLQATVGDAAVDVVVLGLLDTDLPSDCIALFSAHPSIRMLGVVGDGRRAFLYELRPQRFPLGEVSPNGLVDAIRRTSVHVTE